MHRLAFAALLALATARGTAQPLSPDVRFIKQRIATLAGSPMQGRGYVGKGAERAAAWLVRQLLDIGVQPVGKDSIYTQAYSFPVNTFPRQMSLRLGKKDAVPGVDYLIDAASVSFRAENEKVVTEDLLKIRRDWLGVNATAPLKMPPGRVFLLKNVDSAKKLLIDPRLLPDVLPRGAYIIPVKGKMTWTVSTDTTANGATIFYVQDSVLPKRIRRASITADAKFLPATRQHNVMGMVRGTAVPDSFLVFTAHYDHLGKMGHRTFFPGASDNASGCAIVLNLARHFVANPPRYSVLFVFFSGEEAGLKGSKYFTEHPPVPLANMRFLVNLDIMGDATNGVTVVNATEFSDEFAMMQRLNDAGKFLPAIKSRGKAANSDHYWFTEAGVPSFFLYSNGGKGFYHDVFDVPKSLSLVGVDGVMRLLVEFAGALQK